MSVSFQCPACSRQIRFTSGDEAFQLCPHCGGKIIVPATVFHEEQVRVAQPSQYDLEQQRNYRLAEIQSELNAGRKIEAIKLFREAFGSDLATAKTAVEMLERGQRIPTNAISRIAPERPVEQRIHATAPVAPGGTVKSAPVIFWLILSIGILIAVVFLLDK